MSIKGYKKMEPEEVQHDKSFEILDRAARMEEEILSDVKELQEMVR